MLFGRPPSAFFASMRLFSRYCSSLEKSIIVFAPFCAEMRSHKLILAWNAHLVHRKFGFRRYRAGMILLTASFIRLSPLRNGEQGVKIPLFLYQLVEAAGFGDTAVFQDEDAVIAAQERRPPACASRRRGSYRSGRGGRTNSFSHSSGATRSSFSRSDIQSLPCKFFSSLSQNTPQQDGTEPLKQDNRQSFPDAEQLHVFFAILVRVTPGRCPTEKVPEIFIPLPG